MLTDGAYHYPVVDGIPYLRLRGGALRPAVAALRDGDVDRARRILLTDRDRFAPGEPVAADDLHDLRPGSELTLRAAMDRLGYGAVGTYFAHRWSSPTFMSGVALLERTLCAGRPFVEVACGIGHFLRLAEANGFGGVGMDIVWSKLWLAKHFLNVAGPLVCADIEHHLPLPPAERTVFCHDAFYFFEYKQQALRNLRELAGGGAVAIGHVHTRTDAHEAGFAEPVEYYQSLTETQVLSDTNWFAGESLQQSEFAYSLQRGAGLPSSPLWGAGGEADTTLTPPAVAWIEGSTNATPIDLLASTEDLRLNPLLRTAPIVDWPSTGWREEYTADCQDLPDYNLTRLAQLPTIRKLAQNPSTINRLPTAVRRDLRRKRVLLNLPAQW